MVSSLLIRSWVEDKDPLHAQYGHAALQIACFNIVEPFAVHVTIAIVMVLSLPILAPHCSGYCVGDFFLEECCDSESYYYGFDHCRPVKVGDD